MSKHSYNSYFPLNWAEYRRQYLNRNTEQSESAQLAIDSGTSDLGYASGSHNDRMSIGSWQDEYLVPKQSRNSQPGGRDSGFVSPQAYRGSHMDYQSFNQHPQIPFLQLASRLDLSSRGNQEPPLNQLVSYGYQHDQQSTSYRSQHNPPFNQKPHSSFQQNNFPSELLNNSNGLNYLQVTNPQLSSSHLNLPGDFILRLSQDIGTFSSSAVSRTPIVRTYESLNQQYSASGQQVVPVPPWKGLISKTNESIADAMLPTHASVAQTNRPKANFDYITLLGASSIPSPAAPPPSRNVVQKYYLRPLRSLEQMSVSTGCPPKRQILSQYQRSSGHFHIRAGLESSKSNNLSLLLLAFQCSSYQA
jgi:hypothetical protein